MKKFIVFLAIVCFLLARYALPLLDKTLSQPFYDEYGKPVQTQEEKLTTWDKIKKYYHNKFDKKEELFIEK